MTSHPDSSSEALEMDNFDRGRGGDVTDNQPEFQLLDQASNSDRSTSLGGRGGDVADNRSELQPLDQASNSDRSDSSHGRSGNVTDDQSELQLLDQASNSDHSASFRGSLVAERANLSQWFPQINDDESKSWRIWLSRRRRALMVQIGFVGVILVTNLSFTIFAMYRYGHEDGVGLIYEGDCETVKSLNRYIHLLINLLGTGMLSASNYCMQLQAAPTRKNLDDAHAEGRWLDIGVPSLRNLRHLGRKRIAIWFILAVSSIPVHLIYNSAVFQSLASNDYAVAVVKNSFLDGASFDLSLAADRQKGDAGWDDFRVTPSYLNYTGIFSEMQQNSSTYQRRNISSCFELYDDYWNPQGNVIVQVKNSTIQTPTEDSLLIYVYVVPRWDDWPKNLWALSNGTGQWIAKSPSDLVTEWYLGLPRYRVDSCLVQDPNTIKLTCRFQYSPAIMVTVCLMNAIKTFIILWTWVVNLKARTNSDPVESRTIYTLGDAIASFMRKPDPNTIDMGLAEKYDFLRRRKPWYSTKSEPPVVVDGPRAFKRKTWRWMNAASVARWATLVFVFFLAFVVGFSLLGASLTSLRHRNIETNLSGLWDLGFGKITPYTYLVTTLPRKGLSGLISNVLVANLPQLVLSMVYVLYNAMLSTFLVQREFSLMYLTKQRKPLRVSEPVGIQRSSYFISLPLRFGIPLYATSGIMHFLLSQSIFLERITATFPDGTEDKKGSFSACAHSPAALLMTMLAAFLLLLGIIGLGFLKYDGTMRLVATNSRAISAACHVLDEDREDGYLMPVQWGVVSRTGGVGKCAFTTVPPNEMEVPAEGKWYI